MTVTEAIKALRLCPPDQPFVVIMGEVDVDGKIASGKVLTVALVSDVDLVHPDKPGEPVKCTAFFCTES